MAIWGSPAEDAGPDAGPEPTSDGPWSGSREGCISMWKTQQDWATGPDWRRLRIDHSMQRVLLNGILGQKGQKGIVGTTELDSNDQLPNLGAERRLHRGAFLLGGHTPCSI